MGNLKPLLELFGGRFGLGCCALDLTGCCWFATCVTSDDAAFPGCHTNPTDDMWLRLVPELKLDKVSVLAGVLGPNEGLPDPFLSGWGEVVKLLCSDRLRSEVSLLSLLLRDDDVVAVVVVAGVVAADGGVAVAEFTLKVSPPDLTDWDSVDDTDVCLNQRSGH